MTLKNAASALAALLLAGCAPKEPAPVATTPPSPRKMPSVVRIETPAPLVALVEPYLVPVNLPATTMPPTLRGGFAPLPTVPITPLPPAGGLPSAPPATESAPAPSLPKSPPAPTTVAPKRVTALSPAIVRLFEDERAHSVDDAHRRLDAATARASASAAEAKKQWDFVKAGFVAQKQAQNADAAAKDAQDEQANAQKALDDAQRRQRNARRDLEAALRVAAMPAPFALAQLTSAPKTYQAAPGLYRLAILGSSPTSISLQNGAIAKRLPPDGGEAGAWLVRCPDPTKLRVGVGARPATVVVRTLPDAVEKPKA